MKTGRRLRAPREDGGVLIDPPWPELAPLAAANAAAREAQHYDLGGRSLADLAKTARAELIEQALVYTRQYRDVEITRNSGLGTRNDAGASAGSSALRVPRSEFQAPRSALILAGHQPELFHPGVWAKNFAIARLAEQIGGTAVNLVIDGDVLDATTLRVPTGTVDDPRVEAVAFDVPGEAVPYEDRGIRDAETFGSFGRRAAEVVRPLVPEPLLEEFWPLVVEESRRTDRIGACFARARHRLEGRWGLQTLEWPQSRLCESRSFLEFAWHLLSDLPRFVEVHNRALLEYRRAAGIRSANHPVPELRREGEWLEAPLWLWSAENPRRGRTWFRRTPDGAELSDGGRISVVLPFASARNSEAAAAALAELPRRGIRLRSRALLTTMYARLVLGDLFVHGIGGAKYDELTDTIIERFFGLRPPGYAVVTATRTLPVHGRPRSGDGRTSVERRLWELTHHPERYVATTAIADAAAARRARELVAEKQRWIAVEPTRANAKRRCQAIRAVNAALQPFVADLRAEGEKNRESAARRDRAEAVLGSREYACCLFPEKDLRNFLLEIGTEKG